MFPRRTQTDFNTQISIFVTAIFLILENKGIIVSEEEITPFIARATHLVDEEQPRQRERARSQMSEIERIFFDILTNP